MPAAYNRQSKINRERLKEALEQSGHLQKDIAELLFTNEQYLSRRIHSGIIDTLWLHEIARFLQVTPEFLSDEDDKTTASRLRKLRKEKGITQLELAKQCGLGLSTIKQYECGYRVPEVWNLCVLADFYDVAPQWLIGYWERKRK